MNRSRHLLLGALTTALLGGDLLTQTDPPPWWGASDDRTLSLFFDFSGPTPFTPVVVGGPPTWYVAGNTSLVASGQLQLLANLAGHVDVLALPAGAAPALLALTVDNDPHWNWVKFFEIQFDAFEGTGGLIAAAIGEDLASYDRSGMVWESVPIGNGWETVTVHAELWPQPDEEDMDWTFFSALTSFVAIDDLYVSSKCFKVEDADEDGKALGEVDQRFGPAGLDLLALTGTDCDAAAATADAATGLLAYWVSGFATAPGANHELFRLDQTGALTSTLPLPFTGVTAPLGVTDLAVELRRPTPLGRYEPVAVYGLVPQPTGAISLVGFDLLGAPLPTIQPALPALPLQRYGLAYNPSRDGGNGTFVITDPLAGLAYEVTQTGALLDQFPIPPGTRGAGYDHVFGNYYFWTATPEPTPRGALEVNGFVWSAIERRLDGTRFWGNLAVPNPGGPPGGTAAGLDVYRNAAGELKIACIARTGLGSFFYELEGPFEFGRSRHGRTGMRGQPFAGSANFVLTHRGARPNALSAAIYVGFSNVASGGIPLPYDLTPYGLTESQVLISPDLYGGIMPQAATGEFQFLMPTLPQNLRGVPLHFQWLLFDPAVPFGLAMSKAGKTLIY